jgi:hypothetical protein
VSGYAPLRAPPAGYAQAMYRHFYDPIVTYLVNELWDQKFENLAELEPRYGIEP